MDHLEISEGDPVDSLSDVHRYCDHPARELKYGDNPNNDWKTVLEAFSWL